MIQDEDLDYLFNQKENLSLEDRYRDLRDRFELLTKELWDLKRRYRMLEDTLLQKLY